MRKNEQFTEIQYFNKSILLLVIVPAAALLALLISGIYLQLIEGKPFGNHPLSNTGLVVVTLLVMLVLGFVAALIAFTRLETTITRETIAVRYRPFITKWRRITWEEVAQAGVTRYNPLGDYGGWGISTSRRGKAFTIRGNYGLRLTMKVGKPLMIGTQKPDELARFLKTIDRTTAPIN